MLSFRYTLSHIIQPYFFFHHLRVLAPPSRHDRRCRSPAPHHCYQVPQKKITTYPWHQSKFVGEPTARISNRKTEFATRTCQRSIVRAGRCRNGEGALQSEGKKVSGVVLRKTAHRMENSRTSFDSSLCSRRLSGADRPPSPPRFVSKLRSFLVPRKTPSEANGNKVKVLSRLETKKPWETPGYASFREICSAVNPGDPGGIAMHACFATAFW